MNTRPVDGVIIDEHFNASFQEYGLGPWTRKLITIGLPLAESLSDKELIALLAHETAHGANGDVARRWYIHSALKTLNDWRQVLEPKEYHEARDGAGYGLITAIPALLFMYGLSQIPRGISFLLETLLMRESQSAEYLADYLAAECSGVSPTKSLLLKFAGSHSVLDSAVQKAALSTKDIQIFDSLAHAVQIPSDTVLEGIRRKELSRGLSLDATHPPTVFRAAFLDSINCGKEPMTVSDLQMARIRAELSKFKKEISARLIESYRRQLYD